MQFGMAEFKDIKPEVQSLLKAMGYEDDLRGVTHIGFDLPFNGVPKVTIERMAKQAKESSCSSPIVTASK